MAFSLNSDHLDEFVDCLLGVLKLSHFRRLELFGEVDNKGLNTTFAQLNDILTVAVAMKLTVSKILLMPKSSWSEYKDSVISREYAPLLSRRLTASDYSVLKERLAEQYKMGRWVVKLPPETICNFLNCLLKEQSQASKNQQQAEAIVLIMQWLAEDPTESEIINQRQWKETLIKMAGLPAGEKDYDREWQAYKEQWFRLAEFVNRFDKSKYRDLVKEFDDHSALLCKNMVLLQYSEYSEVGFYPEGVPVELHSRQYRAYPVNWIQRNQTESKVSVAPTKAWREKQENKKVKIKQPDNAVEKAWSIRDALQ